MLAPVLGSQAIPGVVKVMLTLALACCVYPMLLATGGLGAGGVASIMVEELDLWGLAPVLAGEVMFGWVIGYCALLPL